ncbi:MAG: hypothetical protein ACD_39C00425G0001 [uncultured bacterium]|nr:MAG: hypothetical protein ACD_39C00425G0001 [uncultured bacterium]
MGLVAGFLINTDHFSLKIFLVALFTHQLEHTRMFGDYDREAFDRNSLFDRIGKFLLLIGINFKDVFHAKPFKHAADRYFFSYLIKVAATRRMVLMAGHCGCSVFHEDQRNVMFVEHRVNNAGDAGMEKCRVTQEAHDPPGIIEQRHTGGNTG